MVGFPTNHFVWLHAYVLRVKLPENDESGLRFWVRGDSGDPERPGEILGFRKTIGLGFMHIGLGGNCLKMTNPGSDLIFKALRALRRTLGFGRAPKNIFSICDENRFV